MIFVPCPTVRGVRVQILAGTHLWHLTKRRQLRPFSRRLQLPSRRRLQLQRGQPHRGLLLLPSKPQDLPDTDASITTDLHGIRSSLTAIQGLAELALAKVRASGSHRKSLQGIVQEVTEVEGLLRRIERKIRPRRPSP